MNDQASSQTSQVRLVQGIIEAGKQAFDPSAHPSVHEKGTREYNGIIESTPTWELLPALNSLIKPNVLPPWLLHPLMQTLTHLPLRSDGVRGTLEFVFSVHPSNSSQTTAEAPHKQGASITHEAVAVATKLLSSVPKDVTSETWFQGISNQIFQLMDGAQGTDLARTAAQIVGFGILGKKQLGAPGAPGWNAFVQPLLQTLNPSLDSEVASLSDDDIVDLSRERVLVTPDDLDRAINRLHVLIISNPSPGLCRRLLRPVLPQLWVLTNVAESGADAKAARDLLQTYLRVSGNTVDTVSSLRQNLLCRGSLIGTDKGWRYQTTQAREGTTIVVEQTAGNTQSSLIDVEQRTAALVDLLISSCSAEDVSSVFIDLLRRWVETVRKESSIKLSVTSPDDDPGAAIQNLIEITMLQKLMDQGSEQLISHFDQLLVLICQLLEADSRSNLEDEILAIVLSLLNLVLTAPTFKKSDINPNELRVVETSLERLKAAERVVSSTAANLAMLLKYRGEFDEGEETTTAPTPRQIEDRRTYNLAMNYITGGDHPPPVVSEGLNLISGLINTESSALDITALAVLLSDLLKNNEDYVNLRVIKLYTQIANKHPISIMRELCDQYLDSQEKSSTDTRLRFGEALVQVIERLGHTFTGESAQQVCEVLLSVAGRRGYRPKTKAKQQREVRLQQLKKQKVNEIDEEDLEDDEEQTLEQQEANDIMTQIVKGWDSKRGSEDVRMRASSLSIFGKAVETNIGGIGSTLVSSAVDLCINILTLESEMEKGILRRAAIWVVLSFVRALDQANEDDRALGFGLTDQSREDITRTLQYIGATDNDGLVQQHARDVVESLENWQMNSLISRQGNTSETPGLGRLAGLAINPVTTIGDDGSSRPRPRIEEIE